MNELSTKVPFIFRPLSRSIFTTQILFGEPLKKKKRIDPLLVKLKVERKIKRLEKSIRQMEKTPLQLKPIEEINLPFKIRLHLNERKRKSDTLEKDELNSILRIWSIYRNYQAKIEKRSIEKVMQSQDKALKCLRHLSPELHKAAISIDENILPYENYYILKDTPAIESYIAPDGEKTDLTKIWKM